MSSTAPQPTFNVAIEDEIVYATRDNSALAGTLYAPRGQGPFPVLIAIHGGGWQRGNRNEYRHVGLYLAQCGVAVFSASYRLAAAGKDIYPAAVQDVRAAVQFIRLNAERLGLDRERIGLIGDSAGGHLGALVALAGDKAPFAGGPFDNHPGVPCAVKVLVGVYGVYDLVAQWRYDQLVRPRDHITENFLGRSLIDDRHVFHEASPLTYATTTAPRCAVLLTWGTADEVVEPRSQSLVFFEALKQSGQYVRTLALPEAPHFWINEDPNTFGSFTGFALPKFLAFLKQRL